MRSAPPVAALLVLLLLWPARATAWQWGATSSGDEFHWEGSCVHWSMVEQSVDNDDSRFDDPAQALLTFEELRAAVRASFDTWEEVPCSYIRFVELEPGHCLDVGHHQGVPNVNRVLFRSDDWIDPAATWRGELMVALSSVFYDTETGEILDVDIEVNSDLHEMSTSLEDVRWDLQNTMTHEVGHLIGFADEYDHEWWDATMFYRAQAGETQKRDLSDNDVEGLCLHYPVFDDPGRCTEPEEGFDLDCEAAASCAEPVDGVADDCVYDELVCCCEEEGGLGRCEWQGWPACHEAGHHAISELDDVTACGPEAPDDFSVCCCDVRAEGVSCEWARRTACDESGRLPHDLVRSRVLCGPPPTPAADCPCRAAGGAAQRTWPTSLLRALTALL